MTATNAQTTLHMGSDSVCCSRMYCEEIQTAEKEQKRGLQDKNQEHVVCVLADLRSFGLGQASRLELLLQVCNPLCL